MPNIQDISKSKKKFKKESYRTWNFSSTSKEEDELCNEEHKKKKEPKSTRSAQGKKQIIKKEEKINTASSNTQKQQQYDTPTSSKTKSHNLSLEQPVSSQLATREQNVSNPLATSEHPVSSQLAAREQDVSNPLATSEQTVSNQLAAREQDVSNSLANPLSSPLAKNTCHYLEPKIQPDGKEFLFLKYLYLSCEKNCSLETTAITTKELKNYLNISSSHLRNLIARASKKGVIMILENNSSPNSAYRIFKFPPNIYKQMNLLVSVKLQEIPGNPLANPLANPLDSSNVVSSSNINTNTTLPEEWNTLNIECLKNHGFNESHIIQIYRAYKKDPDIKLPIEMIQESLYALSYDLECNADKLNIKKSPVLMITNMLKNGNPYSSITPESYLNPRELAIKRYQESKKLREAKLKQIEEDMFNSELEDWLNDLDNFDRVKILSDADIPNNLRPNMKKRLENGHLKTHFEENVWPEIKKSVMSGNRETVS